MMGLAPYGKPQYTERIYEMMDVFEDGSFVLKQKYFSYRWGDRMINKKFDALLGKPRRKASDELLQFHKDMAASIQQVTEEIIEKIVRLSKTQNTSNNLCISGGVGLNCVSNGKISQQGLYENLFLFPACGDDGGAVGSALFLHHQLLNENNSTAPAQKTQPSSGSPYLGPASKNSAIEAFLQENQITFKKLEETEMCKTIAHEIFENNAIIGHFHGRMEFGPRALGNRSILSAPYSPIGYNQVDYLNVNNDPDLIKNVTKYFFEKTMNAWMYSDFEDLLTFLVIKNNKVSVISNKKELENNKRDTDINLIEMKVDFITNHVMSKYDMKSFLKKYALKSGLDLWKLKENKSYVKKSIYKKIKSRLEKLAYH